MEILNSLEQWTAEWLAARSGVITGTRLKGVMAKSGTKARDELVYELISEKVAPIPEGYKSDAMVRWSAMEELAKELYSETSGNAITNVGMVKKFDWLGLSPDGLVYAADWKIRRAVEVKCPEAKNFIRYWIEDVIPSEYHWQVVMYFVVIDDLEELDFVIYNPEIYDSEYRMKTITISRAHLLDDIVKAQEALLSFRSEWVGTMEKLLA